jgi:hypothetical protein
MNLIRLIEILSESKNPEEDTVVFATRSDTGALTMSGWNYGWHSYRGYYDHVALGPLEVNDSSPAPTVENFLKFLRELDGKPMTGYKGGDFFVDYSKPVWVAPYGDTVRTPVLSVEYNQVLSEYLLVSMNTEVGYWF